MPIRDDLQQAMLEGRLGRDHIVLMNSADFDQLRGELTDFTYFGEGHTLGAHIFGVEIFSTNLQDRGSIRIVQRSALTAPPRMVVHPSNLEALRQGFDESPVFDAAFRHPTFIPPQGTFQPPLFIPFDDPAEEPVVEASPCPKSLWELLDEDE